jgi:hypothetical protein
MSRNRITANKTLFLLNHKRTNFLYLASNVLTHVSLPAQGSKSLVTLGSRSISEREMVTQSLSSGFLNRWIVSGSSGPLACMSRREVKLVGMIQQRLALVYEFLKKYLAINCLFFLHLTYYLLLFSKSLLYTFLFSYCFTVCILLYLLCFCSQLHYLFCIFWCTGF